MNEAKFIYNFLNKNYKVGGFEFGYKIVSFTDIKKPYTFESFKKQLVKILGDFVLNHISIIKQWLDDNTTKTIVYINNLMGSLDYEKGSSMLIDEVRERLNNDPFDDDFIKFQFNTFYFNRFLADKIDDLFRTFEVTLGPRNWLIVRGREEITKEKLIFMFKNETTDILNMIVTEFERWIQEQKEELTNKMINNSFN